jgi:hypothetical protein
VNPWRIHSNHIQTISQLNFKWMGKCNSECDLKMRRPYVHRHWDYFVGKLFKPRKRHGVTYIKVVPQSKSHLFPELPFGEACVNRSHLVTNSFQSEYWCLAVFSSIVNTGDWTQGLVLASQGLYTWAIPPVLYASSLFFRQSLVFCPGSASDSNTPTSTSRIAGITVMNQYLAF